MLACGTFSACRNFLITSTASARLFSRTSLALRIGGGHILLLQSERLERALSSNIYFNFHTVALLSC